MCDSPAAVRWNTRVPFGPPWGAASTPPEGLSVSSFTGVPPVLGTVYRSLFQAKTSAVPPKAHAGWVAPARPVATTTLSEPSYRTDTSALFSSMYATRLPSGAQSASTTLPEGMFSVAPPAKCSRLSLPVVMVSDAFTPGNVFGVGLASAGLSPTHPAARAVAATDVILFADICLSPVPSDFAP